MLAPTTAHNLSWNLRGGLNYMHFGSLLHSVVDFRSEICKLPLWLHVHTSSSMPFYVTKSGEIKWS